MRLGLRLGLQPGPTDHQWGRRWRQWLWWGWRWQGRRRHWERGRQQWLRRDVHRQNASQELLQEQKLLRCPGRGWMLHHVPIRVYSLLPLSPTI
jgi:hypothetical protein